MNTASLRFKSAALRGSPQMAEAHIVGWATSMDSQADEQRHQRDSGKAQDQVEQEVPALAQRWKPRLGSQVDIEVGWGPECQGVRDRPDGERKRRGHRTTHERSECKG
jgi:hypothetical protein